MRGVVVMDADLARKTVPWSPTHGKTPAGALLGKHALIAELLFQRGNLVAGDPRRLVTNVVVRPRTSCGFHLLQIPRVLCVIVGEISPLLLPICCQPIPV